MLLWYRAEEQTVLALLQEYVHVRFPDIPAVRIWHWSLLSDTCNMENMACNFEESGILVSLQLLLKYAAVRARRCKLNPERMRRWAQLKKDQFYSESGVGLITMAIGSENLFFLKVSSDSNGVATAHPPANHSELPSWVVRFLAEMSGDVDEQAICHNIDQFLERWNGCGDDREAILLLRSINWSALPLVWKPLFMHDVHVCVTRSEARAAHRNLIAEANSGDAKSEEVVATAFYMLHTITGVATS